MLRAGTNKANRAAGFTLVELLVVIGIIVVLLAVAIPALKMSMQQNKIREAARMVNAYLMLAQSRAAEQGRPVGVWIERSGADTNHAISVFMAEVPPLYTGDFIGATAVINVTPGPDGAWGVASVDDDGRGGVDDPGEAGWSGSDDVVGYDLGPNGTDEGGAIGSDDNFATFGTINWNPSATLPLLVGVGDRIRFNYQGPYYQIRDVLSGPPIRAHFSHPSAPLPGARGRAVPFEIIRQPVRSSATSIELPKGTVIDLDSSGMADSGTEFASANGAAPVVIMFQPSGGIDRVLFYSDALGTAVNIRPLGPVHLLIGRDDENEDNKHPDNLRNLTNLWVSVGHFTGSITTSENGQIPSSSTSPVADARALARRAQTMGGT